jgi:hypothetical protein
MNFTRNYFVSLLFLIWSLKPIDSSSILLYTAFGSYSHKIAMWPLAESLVARGHQVTFLSAFDKIPSPNANITDYNPKMFTEWFLSADEEYASRIFDGRSSLSTKIMDWVIMIHLGVEVCDKQLRDPEFIAWVHRSQFDLVMRRARGFFLRASLGYFASDALAIWTDMVLLRQIGRALRRNSWKYGHNRRSRTRNESNVYKYSFFRRLRESLASVCDSRWRGSM